MTKTKMVIVRAVYEWREASPELSYAEIARRVSSEFGERVTGEQCWRWINNPDRYSPWLDEIAIGRALDGDRGAFNNLSTYEETEFWYRTIAKVAKADILTENVDDGHGGYWYNVYTEFITDCLKTTQNNMSERQKVAMRYRPLHREGLDDD